MKEQNYKLVAPDIDRLLNCFERGHLNPSGITPKLDQAMKPLFKVLAPLAPLKSNNEAKTIWIQVPRGDILDFDSFEDLKDWGEVETYTEYENLWKQEYPDEVKWYKLVIVEGKNHDGQVDFKAVALGNKTIISARMDEEAKENYKDDYAVTLCNLIIGAAEKSIQLLKSGKYNDMVQANLPYEFRIGVIKRSDLWKHDSEYKKFNFDNLSEEKVSVFRSLLLNSTCNMRTVEMKV